MNRRQGVKWAVGGPAAGRPSAMRIFLRSEDTNCLRRIMPQPEGVLLYGAHVDRRQACSELAQRDGRDRRPDKVANSWGFSGDGHQAGSQGQTGRLTTSESALRSLSTDSRLPVFERGIRETSFCGTMTELNRPSN